MKVGKLRVLIIGSSEEVTRLCLQRCLANPQVARVILSGRVSDLPPHPKLTVLSSFERLFYEDIRHLVLGLDTIFYCSDSNVSQAWVKKFSVSDTAQLFDFLEVVRDSSPEARLCVFESKPKGVAHQSLRLGFESFYCFAPNYLQSSNGRPLEAGWKAKFLHYVFPLLRPFITSLGVKTEELVEAMLLVGFGRVNPEKRVVDEKEILNISRP